MSQINLPFEVGHTIEARSFELGFRGAWFRCKITKIFNKGRALLYDLEYLDFTEEGIHTTKVFQKRHGENESTLMVRPIRPRHENEDGGEEVEEDVVVVVHGVWKVGDLVDWWKDDCFWSGTVLEVREDDESVKVELLPEPYGEGKSYDAVFKDLRPSLEWSLEDGWTVPFSKDGEKRQCAKLMKLLNEEAQMDIGAEETREEEKLRPTTKKLVVGDDEDLALNIMESESIEAAVMDLEELVVRIEWIKGMLSLNSDNSTWLYEDYLPSS